MAHEPSPHTNADDPAGRLPVDLPPVVVRAPDHLSRLVSAPSGPAVCCSPTELASCCRPAARDDCCGAAGEERCRCR
jgi:hypothetical protein